MSRVKNYLSSVAAGYLNLGTNIVYSLASVPLALHYLTREEFGLWALVTQLAWYLMLIDTGMSNATGRRLIDHKDERASGVYGSVLKTGLAVLLVQGIILWIATIFAAPLVSAVFLIPAQLAPAFERLLIFQAAISALSLPARGVGQLLFAHARTDLINLSISCAFVVNLAVTWLAFAAGSQLFSLIYGAAAAFAIAALLQCYFAYRYEFFPHSGEWGRTSWKLFAEIFTFGRKLFLITLGTNLMLTTQTMIVTRCLGLEAAAAWSVGTKVFTLLVQVVGKLFEPVGPILSEMWVRGERTRIVNRTRDVLVLCLVVSVFCGCGLTICNSTFVRLWTHGRIDWHWSFDLLLAVWLCDLIVNRILSLPVLASKELRLLGTVYVVEGVVFVSVGLWLVPRAGIVGLIALSLLCSLISGSYLVARNRGYSRNQVHFWEWATWNPAILVSSLLVATGIAVTLATDNLPALPQFITRVVALCTAGAAAAITAGQRTGLLRKLAQQRTKPSFP
jgi:O-antigen/teichoic acid export membrane protein